MIEQILIRLALSLTALAFAASIARANADCPTLESCTTDTECEAAWHACYPDVPCETEDRK